MRVIAAVIATFVFSAAPIVARADPFNDAPILHAGTGVTLTAHRATVRVPGLAMIDGASVYDAAAGAPHPGGALLSDRLRHGSLMPPVIAADRGATLRILFRNDLRVHDALGKDHPSTSNIHTHGLIVSPEGFGFGAPHATPVYGDCVFVLGTAPGPDSEAAAGHMAGHAGATADPCSTEANRPPMVTGGEATAYSYPIAADHPSGLFWVHPHVHGQSEPQVSNGLGALLTVGSLWDYSYLDCKVSTTAGEAGVPVCGTQAEQRAELEKEAAADAGHGLVRIRYLALKDIQVAAGKRPGAPFRLIEFPRRPTDPKDPSATAFGSANDDRKGLCGQLNLGAKLSDDLAYATPPTHPNPAFGRGQCWNADDASKRWVFTVSGQVFPLITMRPDQVEVWRLANTSADVTYRLHLVTTNEAKPRRLLFTVRALDGVAAPERSTDEITLMPSARIEVIVRRCDGGPGEDPVTCVDPSHRVTAHLRTAGVATGIKTPLDPNTRDGDQWPAVDLADVTFEPVKAQALAPRLKTSPTPGVLVAPATKLLAAAAPGVMPLAPSPVPAAAAPAGAAPAAPPPPACDWSAYKTDPQPFGPDSDLVRFLRFNNNDFGDANGGELFGIHAENRHLTDGTGASVTVGDLIRDGASAPTAGQPSLIARLSLADPCHDVPGGLLAPDFARFYPAFDMSGPSTMTAWAGGVEYWLVVNDSRECHNFHVHQMKFTVVDADVVVSQDGDTASQDQCLGDRKLVPPITQSALHDNYPLPPGARILFRLTFDGPKLGRFVFHCHILEHEDKGMMATIDVVKKPASQAGLAGPWFARLFAPTPDPDPLASLSAPICRADPGRNGDASAE